ncbi:LOW QUALITY PROTEIN: hypothetical protein RJ641_016915 [Dillenia turbinata]|uniref:Uncharacterized protein n=1 Tax=Dillenia turbinata TaxID=194707 RepID=A0AAN8UZ98_9MAGN
MHEGLGNFQEALAAYIDSLLLEPGYVQSKILISSMLSKMGSKALPVARTILTDALRVEPTNRMAWYYLGMIHKDDGRISDAADCFQAATMLEEYDPVESFSSIRMCFRQLFHKDIEKRNISSSWVFGENTNTKDVRQDEDNRSSCQSSNYIKGYEDRCLPKSEKLTRLMRFFASAETRGEEGKLKSTFMILHTSKNKLNNYSVSS